MSTSNFVSLQHRVIKTSGFNFIKARKVTFFLISSLFLLNCSNSYVDDIDRTGLYEYRPGFPELNIVTAGVVDELTDSTFLNVSADIIYSSLIFKNVAGVLKADLVLEIQILDMLNMQQIVETREYPHEVILNDQSELRSDKKASFVENIPAKPSNYKIRVSVTDLNSNKQTIRSSEAYIPNPNDGGSYITNIRILGKADEASSTYTPVTSYDVSAELDSIRFVFQVTNNKSNSPLTFRSRLIRFESDTMAARPMSWPNQSPSHLSYIGIRYSKYEEIATSVRTISRPGNVNIEYNFPNLMRGNYRFEVFTEDESENNLYRAREFGVKSVNYPSVRTPYELAAPLIYLMGKKEHDKMLAITDPVELKYQIDRFWLNNLQNKRIAQNVIELFYERVEEANKQFSNYKEGWKTDFGFMYILFGPPMYITTNLSEVVWSYSHNLYDPETNFVFRNPKIKSKYYPFENYILSRNSAYFSLQYQQVQQWLSGTILTDNL